MLNSINLDDKKYEDLMAEAVAKIPLYSGEWTNFNRSDPGITMLQNLTSFSLLQQSAINEITDEIRRALLALAGCRAEENRPATLLLQAPSEASLALPPQYRVEVGSLPFETAEPISCAPWGLAAVYIQQEETWREISYLLDAQSATAAVFGQRPEAGNALCCILSGVPPTDHPLLLWVQVPEEGARNPFPQNGGPSFAQTRWQYYTAEGWQDATAADETRGFLVSGEITLTLDRGDPVPFPDTPVQGCALRCLLERADYDRPPRLQALAANLFPVRQWETRTRCYPFSGEAEIAVLNPLAALGNLFVYCQEEPGGPYRLYAPYTGITNSGRLYLREDCPSGVGHSGGVSHSGGVRLTFHGPRFGYAPWAGDGAVQVLCCDNDMVHHRDLGLVYGHEDQEVPLDLVENVLPGRFSLLVCTQAEDGDEYRFVPPDTDGPGGFLYRLSPQAGSLCIVRPGGAAGARLYLGDCCVTRGALGNVRPGGRLLHREEGVPPQYFGNPAPGRGGGTYETAEDLRRRYVRQVRQPAAAVLPTDYEALILRTPGLCIHKVRAVPVPGRNLVRITVKPRNEEALPTLSPLYLREMQAWLEPRRMLTTRVELLQPRYVPVNVRAVVYVKNYFDNAAVEIEALLRGALDYVNGPQGFGARVRFSQLHQSLLDLPCVEAVDDLRLLPAGREGVAMEGPDLVLDDQTLCYPGAMQVELHVRSSVPEGRPGRR